MRRCQYVEKDGSFCNNRIRTGIKYCYMHRNAGGKYSGKYGYRGIGKLELSIILIFVLIVAIISSATYYFSDTSSYNKDKRRHAQFENECKSNNGFVYDRYCLDLVEINQVKDSCNSNGTRLFIKENIRQTFDSTISFYCYLGMPDNNTLLKTEQNKFTDCEKIDGVPLLSDRKVTCIENLSVISHQT